MVLVGQLRRILVEKVLRHAYEYGYVLPVISWTSRYPLGTNVFERDWDALILLDTCRVDALQTVADEYEFLPENVGRMLSVGSTSSEWIAHTFSEPYSGQAERTAYISANGHAKYVLEDERTPDHIEDVPAFSRWRTLRADDLGALEHVWQIDDGTPGHVHPDIVTDRTIAIGRNTDHERIVVHYSQPHAPYAARAIREEDELSDHERRPFRYLLHGGSRQRVYDAYLDNLRFVLDSVELLLENLEAPKTVITADHGEAFGEWSFYGHQIGALHPQVKFVPWAEVTAEDTGMRTPEMNSSTESERSVEEHLEALGYV